MKFNQIYLFIPLISLISCQLTSQESVESIRLKDKSNAKISLEKESKGFFINSISGSANGPEIFQKMGSLSDVVRSFSGEKDVEVEGISSKNVFKITVEDYPSDQINTLETDILDFMSEEVGFSWTIKNRSAEYHSMQVANYELFKTKAKSKTENGAIKMVNLSHHKLEYFGTLDELEKVIEENLPEVNFIFDLPEVDFKVDLELSIKNISALRTTLKAYGINLKKQAGDKETILIKAK